MSHAIHGNYSHFPLKRLLVRDNRAENLKVTLFSTKTPTCRSNHSPPSIGKMWQNANEHIMKPCMRIMKVLRLMQTWRTNSVAKSTTLSLSLTTGYWGIFVHMFPQLFRFLHPIFLCIFRRLCSHFQNCFVDFEFFEQLVQCLA